MQAGIKTVVEGLLDDHINCAHKLIGTIHY